MLNYGVIIVVSEKKHISIGAMRSDLPICGGSKGVPYSMSCLPQPSNPYQKACLKIYSKPKVPIVNPPVKNLI
ncbi:hypothetical protein G4B88_004509 [Cannabis sativa]|uniref:Uncharacterized protein n=1 Tax=Cannabis sativa TaxID=3483 RepID=A0A7J6EHD6_CANSA|nr:hypothetical protein G4B88_004509 [Cannabis sativa]